MADRHGVGGLESQGGYGEGGLWDPKIDEDQEPNSHIVYRRSRYQRLRVKLTERLRVAMACMLAAAAGSATPAAAQDPTGQPPVAEVVAILGFTEPGR